MRYFVFILFCFSGYCVSAQSHEWINTDSAGRLILHINDLQEKKFTVKIYDDKAKEIFTEILDDISLPHTRHYNVDYLPRGIYFIALQPETGRRKFKKIMLE
jgi:hypothetical protein